ncbi:MAG: gephyrin-like molybdotransferase Glp [Geitlerinemataceae cyanobacterium]
MSEMIPVREAEAIVLDAVRSFDADRCGKNGDLETVPLADADGRILAQPVASRLDFPHWDNSAMDGYAVCFADVAAASEAEPVTLALAGEIPAGRAPDLALERGQAARIFTGAMLPDGADTIVMQENTTPNDHTVSVNVAPPQIGHFVRKQGQFCQAGETLLPAGTRIAAAELAVLASAQCTAVPVFRRPRVAVLSTGRELVSPEDTLKPGQIVDSNRIAIASFLTQHGAEVIPFGIIDDDREATAAAISRAIDAADLVISTGGVSVGDYDYVEDVLEELGGEIRIRKIAIKPGKPLTFATFDRGGNSVAYFGLPGNPVSALVGCWRFVRSALLKRSGLARGWEPQFVRATLREGLKAGGGRETYVWGALYYGNGGFEFDRDRGSINSGNAIGLALCNGLAVVPVGEKAIGAGEVVEVLQMGSPIF